MHKRNPYSAFVEYNQIEFTKEDEEKYLSVVKAPEDYKELMEDIMIIGKREVGSLIKWRDRLRTKLKIDKPEKISLAIEDDPSKKDEKAKSSKKMYDSREDEILEDELEQNYLAERKKEKQANKDKERRLMQFAKSGGGQKSAENMVDEALEQE